MGCGAVRCAGSRGDGLVLERLELLCVRLLQLLFGLGEELLGAVDVEFHDELRVSSGGVWNRESGC